MGKRKRETLAFCFLSDLFLLWNLTTLLKLKEMVKTAVSPANSDRPLNDKSQSQTSAPKYAISDKFALLLKSCKYLCDRSILGHYVM